MITQIIIAFTGMIAIWLTQQDNDDWKKYACLFGIVGQPFWFYSAYTSEQWGILVLTFFYTYSWYIGINNNWIKYMNEPKYPNINILYHRLKKEGILQDVVSSMDDLIEICKKRSKGIGINADQYANVYLSFLNADKTEVDWED